MSFSLQSMMAGSSKVWVFLTSFCMSLNVPNGRVRWRLNFTAQMYWCTVSRICFALEKSLVRFSGFSKGRSRARMIFDFLFSAACSILSLKDKFEAPFLIWMCG